MFITYKKQQIEIQTQAASSRVRAELCKIIPDIPTTGTERLLKNVLTLYPQYGKDANNEYVTNDALVVQRALADGKLSAEEINNANHEYTPEESALHDECYLKMFKIILDVESLPEELRPAFTAEISEGAYPDLDIYEVEDIVNSFRNPRQRQDKRY